MTARPCIGIIPGDPAGIGPEIVARLLGNPETHARADVVLIGDRAVIERGQAHADAPLALSPIAHPAARTTGQRKAIPWIETATIDPDAMALAEASEAGGRSTLRTLDIALDLATDGAIDAIVFGPFNKSSMHMAGLGHPDELHYMAARLGVTGYVSELNTLDGIWTSRVTSHIALRHVAHTITHDRLISATRLADATLRRSGVRRPRIAVAALNPHAGDNGNFGREEIDVIAPAIAAAQRLQINVDGPWPSDTVFLKARDRMVDAVVTMYHDQGQIALKLMGFDRGVTVQGGLPVPVATPAHGTAFDIAGRGIAEVSALQAAFSVACDMATNWTAA